MKRSVVLIMLIIVLSLIPLGTTRAQGDGKQYVIANMILVGNDGFRDEMNQLGYVEGENTTYLYVDYSSYTQETTPEEWQAEYQRQIQAMLDAGTDVFVTNTDTDAVALQALVGNIPIIFARSDDPVSTKAVASLINPGGTMTGIMTNKPHERRLQILTEINPETDLVYYLYTSYSLEADVVLQQVQTLADELGVEVVVAKMDPMDEASTLEVVQGIPDGTDWIFMTPYSYFYYPEPAAALLEKVFALGAGVAGVTDVPTQGYVVGYGPNMDATGRQAAHIIDRILRGASPADLPVETAENYLEINLEAAASSGMDIPESILRQANTIIRPGYFESLTEDTPES
ncbi:MAG TPA: ABC transporter substrate binding protein [Aggregatilineaceae bacterium]|nr:ABC transporter substrate binding protein [Aggregatilineaceae bacterium]